MRIYQCFRCIDVEFKKKMPRNIWAIVEMIIMRSAGSYDRESRPYLLSGEAD